MTTQWDRYKVIEKYLTKEQMQEISDMADEFFNSEFKSKISDLTDEQVAICMYAGDLLRLKFSRLRGRALASLRKREKNK